LARTSQVLPLPPACSTADALSFPQTSSTSLPGKRRYSPAAPLGEAPLFPLDAPRIFPPPSRLPLSANTPPQSGEVISFPLPRGRSTEVKSFLSFLHMSSPQASLRSERFVAPPFFFGVSEYVEGKSHPFHQGFPFFNEHDTLGLESSSGEVFSPPFAKKGYQTDLPFSS